MKTFSIGLAGLPMLAALASCSSDSRANDSMLTFSTGDGEASSSGTGDGDGDGTGTGDGDGDGDADGSTDGTTDGTSDSTADGSSDSTGDGGPDCGNGQVDAGEQCDDGNDDNADACPNSCELAFCGDGYTQAGVEECDDGNDIDTDDCLPVFCTAATCGDGYVHEGNEECDDGNDVDNDACPTTCVGNVCGDGFKYEGMEECDDGDDDDTDFCNSQCILLLKPNILVCGGSSRDMSVIFPMDVPFTLVDSCTPDDETQAMLITRSNSFNGQTVKTYIEDGGIVLTEWSSSDNVFTAVFSAVAESGWYGSCTDIAPTVVQFNQGDQFWQDNQWQGIGLDQSGCGTNDIDSWPQVTTLAGWSNTEAAIGYRDLGSGRLWLTEYDWSDGEDGDFSYSAELMGYMIMNGG